MNAPKRIAVISSVFPPEDGGGMASAHHGLIQLFRGAGHTVRAFTFASTTREDGEETVRRGPPDRFMRGVRSLTRNWFRLADRGAVAYQTADILRFAWGARRLVGPLRRFAPEILVAPDHGAPMAWLPRLPNCQHVLICHHNPMRFLNNPLLGVYSVKDARLAVALEQRAVDRMDRVVCPSAYMRGVFSETFRFAGPVAVIPNLIDANSLDAIQARDLRGELGLPPDAPLIYIPSAGSKYKGTRFVFEIMRRLSKSISGPVGFFLSGTVAGQTAYELTFLPDNARLFMPGRLSHSENMRGVKACDVAVSSTLVENFSMAFLEAATCGVPVVTFDVGGNSEVVIESASGFLAPFLDLEALIERTLYVLDRSRCAEMKVRAKETVRSEFAPEKWLPAWEAQFTPPGTRGGSS